MTLLGQTKLREYIVNNYEYIKGNWDIYMAFLERGLLLSNNCLCYITPDKWLSKPFGSKFREKCMIPRLKTILHTGNKTFESATVDAIITLFLDKSNEISAYRFDKDKNIILMNTVLSKSIIKPYYIDSLFSEHNFFVSNMERGAITLKQIAECENACATNVAYELSPYVFNVNADYDPVRCLKLVNTGTIDKYANKWGVKEITYLGSKYIYPVVDKNKFRANFGVAYVRKAFSRKLIFKGLNLLDGFIDFNGEYLPGKTTLVICSDNISDLKFLCGLLNSKLALFYIKLKYASSSYCGGITFSKDMINNFPIRENIDIKNRIIDIVDAILAIKQENPIADISIEEFKIDLLTYRLYGLTYDEVLIVDPQTPITCEEYEN